MKKDRLYYVVETSENNFTLRRKTISKDEVVSTNLKFEKQTLNEINSKLISFSKEERKTQEVIDYLKSFESNSLESTLEIEDSFEENEITLEKCS